ncbi:hypothetical protein [Burkholderia ubonensis]|uniref:hypothetical protein n=1 Tax=Burkholderia ubonensis TaxID=101571 RepID=UPI000AEA7327|nr:hypothetical protein [Burkholderia ubonensis]
MGNQRKLVFGVNRPFHGALEVKPYRHVEKLGDFGATAVGNVAPVEAQLEASNAVTLV